LNRGLYCGRDPRGERARSTPTTLLRHSPHTTASSTRPAARLGRSRKARAAQIDALNQHCCGTTVCCAPYKRHAVRRAMSSAERLEASTSLHATVPLACKNRPHVRSDGARAAALKSATKFNPDSIARPTNHTSCTAHGGAIALCVCSHMRGVVVHVLHRTAPLAGARMHVKPRQTALKSATKFNPDSIARPTNQTSCTALCGKIARDHHSALPSVHHSLGRAPRFDAYTYLFAWCELQYRDGLL